MLSQQSKRSGFTIVELLVVIVVIGILAALTIVSYTGMTHKAAAATLQSDLKNAQTQLELDKATTGSYPANQGAANGGKGLPKSSDTVYQYTVVGSEYQLSATAVSAGIIAYHISSTVGNIEADVWSGHTPPPGTPVIWKQIASGNNTCGIASNNLFYCWGYNSDGQIGDNSTTQRLVPTAVDTSVSSGLNGKTVKSFGVSTFQACAIASDDLLYCWGRNNLGQLGDSTTTQRNVPTAVSTAVALNGKTVLSIMPGYNHICAIASDNLAYCWGFNSSGQIGDNSTTQRLVPTAVSTAVALNGKTVKSMTSGTDHTCVIASDNLAYCWGNNDFGQLGDNTSVSKSVPVAVNTAVALNGKTIKSISAAGKHTCAIASDDKAYCWGLNDYGELGNASNVRSSVPVVVNTAVALAGKTIKSISAGENLTCVIASDDLAYCWGGDDYGQLGNSAPLSHSNVPVAVTVSGVLSGKTIKSIDTGVYHACVIASDNQRYCWGNNGDGAFGDNSTTNSSSPVVTQVPPQS